MEKRCRKCNEVKPLSDFHKLTASPDGRQYRCKSCSIASARQSALNNPEKKRAADAKYGKSDKCKANRKARREGEQREAILSQKRDFHETHKAEINANRRAQRAADPEAAKAYQREYYLRNRGKKTAYSRAWNAAHREQRKSYMRKKVFQLTDAAYDAMVIAQNEMCAICGIHMESNRELMPTGRHRTGVNVDHCHETGKVRALLCSPCNKGLGQFRDNPEALRIAADYIEKHRALAEATA